MNKLKTQASQTKFSFDMSCINLHWDQEDQFQDALDELTDAMMLVDEIL